MSEVKKMTLDQICMMLTDRKNLKRRDNVRSLETPPLATVGMADEKGLIKGRAADDTPIQARIAGVSKARQLTEAAAKRRKKKSRKRKR